MRLNRVAALIRQVTSFHVAFFVLASLACAQAASKNAPSDQAAAKPAPTHYNFALADLPPPEVQKGPVNFSRVIPRHEGANLTVPSGFDFRVFAAGALKRPRMSALAPNGDIFVAESEGDRISVLRDKDNDGKVDERFVFASNLARPFGMAFWRDRSE